MALQFDLTTLAAMASDVLLGLGAAGAALYCMILSRRLKRFNNLENGVGGAVAVLSAQVDDMTKTLDEARASAESSARSLTTLTERAETSARKLEIMMASLHDLPDAPGPEEAAQDATWTKAMTKTTTEAKPEAETETSGDSLDADDTVPLFSTKRAQGGVA